MAEHELTPRPKAIGHQSFAGCAIAVGTLDWLSCALRHFALTAFRRVKRDHMYRRASPTYALFPPHLYPGGPHWPGLKGRSLAVEPSSV